MGLLLSFLIANLSDSNDSETNWVEGYDSAYTDDDDLDAPRRVKIRNYHSQSQSRSQKKSHKITHIKVSDGESVGLMVKEEVKVRTKSRGEGMGEKILMTEDEEEDEYEKWRKAKQRDKERKRKRVRKEGGASGIAGGDGAIKKQKLSVDKSNRPIIGKRTTVAARSKQGAVVGRRPSVSEYSLTISLVNFQ
ncbi:hypothetical protein BGX38DRAFT_109121 [Terfezia claveryi]|nr:hypothetical protein BGX38DRAFT_109121 [Terfezia claveryi]